MSSLIADLAFLCQCREIGRFPPHDISREEVDEGIHSAWIAGYEAGRDDALARLTLYLLAYRLESEGTS